jgi:hypothetical protein
LVFIDETWTKTNMTRLRGWAPKGERLVDKVPHGRWKTATFLAALRNDRKSSSKPAQRGPVGGRVPTGMNCTEIIDSTVGYSKAEWRRDTVFG